MFEIEIFSDVVCPWCFIGKSRLDAVLKTEVGEGISVRWRPYLLHPLIPSEGLDRAQYMQQRYGAQADSSKAPSRIIEEAAAEGLVLRYDLIKRVPNTQLAHLVLAFSFAYGVQHELAQALFEDYFCLGRDVGDLATLLETAQRFDLPLDALQKYLSHRDAQVELQQQLDRAPDLGLSGVPGYYLAGRFLLPGAQDQLTMTQIIKRVKTKLEEGKTAD